MFINGWTKEKFFKRIEERNGFDKCHLGESCLYRDNDNGTACIVGAFIPDNLYEQGMENKCAEIVIERYNLETYMPLPTDLMQRLQEVHDNWLDVDTEYETTQDHRQELEDKLNEHKGE